VVGATATRGLLESQLCYILKQVTDVNIISWLIKQQLLHIQNNNSINIILSTQLSAIETSLPLLQRQYNPTFELTHPAPPPLPAHTLQYGNPFIAPVNEFT
jgi:hypothetical protein